MKGKSFGIFIPSEKNPKFLRMGKFVTFKVNLHLIADSGCSNSRKTAIKLQIFPFFCNFLHFLSAESALKCHWTLKQALTSNLFFKNVSH